MMSLTKEWELSLLESEKMHNLFIHNFFNTNNVKSNDMNELMGKDGWIEMDDETNENNTTSDTIGSDYNSGNISPNSQINNNRYNRSPSNSNSNVPNKNFVTLFPSISLVTQKASIDQDEAPNRIGFSEKIGRRLLCPPSPLSMKITNNKVSQESLVSLQLSSKSSGGSLLSTDETTIKSIKSETVRRPQSIDSNISNTSNNQNLSLLRNISNDSSMQCQASSSDSCDTMSPTTVTRMQRNCRIDSIDSLYSNNSSVDDTANNSLIQSGSLNLKAVDDSLREWQTQSPVTVRREDAVMALIQEEFQRQPIINRNRSISAPILCENANILQTKNSFSPPPLVRSKTVSSLDKKKIPNSDFRLNKKTRSLDDIPEEEHIIGRSTYELANKVLSKERINTFLEMNNYAYKTYLRMNNN